jgi:EpsI family protein
LTPRNGVPDTQVPRLGEMVPQTLGDWRALSTGLIQADLTTDGGEVARVYDQVLTRTYRRSDGAMVMLALAYRQHQRQELKIHRPELCYGSQGFRVLSKNMSTFGYAGRQLDSVRLLTRSDVHFEPVTYWIRIGDELITNAWQSRGIIFRDGLLGRIPDGILVRVSSPTGNAADVGRQYQIQDEFLQVLVAGVDATGKRMLLGDVYRSAASGSPNG